MKKLSLFVFAFVASLLFLSWSANALWTRDGRTETYDLKTINNVLNGKGKTCEQAITKSWLHHYECNNTWDYKQIKEFLSYLQNGKYQKASDLIGSKKTLMPYIMANNPISSWCEPWKWWIGYCIRMVHETEYYAFVPYKNWIIGISRLFAWDSFYKMQYITIDNWKLHLFESKGGFYIWYDSKNKVTELSRSASNVPKTIDKYNIKLSNSCYSNTSEANHIKCVKSYLKSVLTNKIKDKNTTSWINAMKKKINNLYK